ncbi:MAG TPA: hypothetical protein VKS99_01495, partial [Blastocatellia bacterium]|nr:hypothetical protein [Blastocatellia bacterium]
RSSNASRSPAKSRARIAFSRFIGIVCIVIPLPDPQARWRRLLRLRGDRIIYNDSYKEGREQHPAPWR